MALKPLSKTAMIAALFAGFTFVETAAAQERAGRATLVARDAFQAISTVGVGVQENDEIYRYARVYTKQYGTMEIALEDGTDLTIAPSASIVIDDYVYGGPGASGALALSLSRGALRVVSGRMSKDSYSVKTGVATIGVRGTTFWLDAADPDLLKIWTLEGVVTAQPAQSDTVFEFTAPAYAECTVAECTSSASLPPTPEINPLNPTPDPAIDNGEDPGADESQGGGGLD